MYYAQLNENNICIAISQLSGEVKQDNMIHISDEEYSPKLLGCKYENGTWLEMPKEEFVIKVEPTETELIIMAAQAENYEKQLAIEENQYALMMAVAELYERSVN